MTYLAIAAFAVFSIHSIANGFVYPPVRRAPKPSGPDYWPGYLHRLEGGL